MSSGINPEKGVLPVVGQFNLDLMIACRTARATWPKDCLRAFTVATDTLKNQLSPFVSSDSRRTASLAEGSHILLANFSFRLNRRER